MKKNYEEPILEIITIASDILTASGNEGDINFPNDFEMKGMDM